MNEAKRRERWEAAFESILEDVRKTPSEHVLLGAHGFYWRKRQLLCDLNWDFIAEFDPDVIVTLYDDIYDVQHRIAARDPADRERNRLCLREILVWRSAEIAVGDLLARMLFVNPGRLLDENAVERVRDALEGVRLGLFNLIFKNSLKNFCFPVKQPISALYRLLFQENRLAIYLSYPISKIRDNEEDVKAINRLRQQVNQKHTTFDPVSVDEYILSDREGGKQLDKTALHAKYEGQHFRVFEYRWPFGPLSMIPPEEEAIIDGTEYVEVLQDIKFQIAKRDFRLIDQVHWLGGVVVCYRPCIRGHEPGGVREEIGHAIDLGMPVYAYWPKEDDEAVGAQGPLDPYENVERFSTLEELYSKLEEEEARG